MVERKKKRILNIVPVVNNKWNAVIRETLETYASPEFELGFRNVKYGGTDSIEGERYIAVTVPYIVDEIIQAEKEGYDACDPSNA